MLGELCGGHHVDFCSLHGFKQFLSYVSVLVMCQEQEMNYLISICEGTIMVNFPQPCKEVVLTLELTTVDAS